MVIRTGANLIIIEVNTPIFTTLAPGPGSPGYGVSFVVPPIPYFSARDLDSLCRQRNAGTSIFTAGQQPLQIALVVTALNNNAPAGASFQVTVPMLTLYRVVRSLQEG